MRWTLWLTAALMCAVAACNGGDDSDGTIDDEDTAADIAEGGDDTAGSGDVADEPDTTEPLGDACAPQDVDAAVSCVSTSRYEEDLRYVAQPRPPGSDHWLEVQDTLVERLEAMGYDVTRSDYGTGTNVVATLEGTTTPGERIYIGAHYDHIPNCNGADDNGTGTVGALEAAYALGGIRHDRTLVIALWDEEELGLVGSAAHAMGVDDPEGVLAYYNFEMLGYVSDEPDSQQLPDGIDLIFQSQYERIQNNEFRGDFIALIANQTDNTTWIPELTTAIEEQGAPAIDLVVPDILLETPQAADFRRSDHASFWDIGVPAVMITDTANFRNQNYHCAAGPDVVEDLDLDFATNVVRGTVAAAYGMLNP